MAEIIDNIKVGLFIKELLKENRMTQDDLANELHITKAAVSQNLNGRNSFDIENLMKIAKLFKISLDDLIATRRPIDQPDIDSEYIRMMKRGFEDFKQHPPQNLNIGKPDVYGKLFIEYLMENSHNEWIQYIIENKIAYADMNLQLYSPLTQKIVLYLLKNKLQSPEIIIEAFANKFGQFNFDNLHDREEFMLLISQNQEYKLFEKLIVHKIQFTSTKFILFLNFKINESNPIYNRKILIEDIIRLKLFDLWKLIVDLILKHQSFIANERFFLMLTKANFLEGLIYFIQNIPIANRLETFGSDSVSKAMEYLMKSKQVPIIMQSIKKQFVYDLNELAILAIKHNVLELVEQIIQTYPTELKARKIALTLSTTLNFEFIEKYPLIFSSDVLSYTLDHLSLLEAQPNVLNGLVKIGATFNSKYMNQDTAEKINRLLIKTKKGKN
jgi:transcriptional regulator with XRE-family HTH domain